MSVPLSIIVDQEAATATLSRTMRIGTEYAVAITLDGDKEPLFESGEAYTLTLKPSGEPSAAPYGQWTLTRVSETAATVVVDLALDALDTAIGDDDSLPCILGLDHVGGGPLLYTNENQQVRLGNHARRDDDVAEPATGTPISAEEVAAAIAAISGLTLSDADPAALAESADPGTSEAAARGDHAHPLPDASDVGAAPASHVTSHPAPTTRDTRNEAAGTASGLLTTHETTHPSPTTRDTRNYRTQSPATAANKGGASVAPNFEDNLTLPWTLTSNLTSFAAATNLADGETGMVLITIGEYSLPADPPAGSHKGAWTVTGPLVRVIVERIGSAYLWSADSLEVVS